jgi:hypothetical protein
MKLGQLNSKPVKFDHKFYDYTQWLDLIRLNWGGKLQLITNLFSKFPKSSEIRSELRYEVQKFNSQLQFVNKASELEETNQMHSSQPDFECQMSTSMSKLKNN